MSDTSATIDVSMEADTTPISDGLDSQPAGFETSTPTEMDGYSDGAIAESQPAVESVFDIDGTPITLDEAKNGYLRQSDYTRKTQELAEMRSRLAEAEAIAEALRANPVATLNALSDAFGVGLQAQGQSDPFEDMDPESARIAMLEQKVAAQEQAALQAAIDAEVSNLHQQYGEFNEQELFAHAVKGNFPNLRAAYADMHFTQVQERLAAIERKQAEEAARVAAKRDQASVIHDTGARAGGSVTEAQPTEFGSVREAYMAAKRSLGY